MSLAENDPTNEVVRNNISAFEDIYVPGIGVRDALRDDEESSDLRRLGERCASGAAFVNRWAVRTFGSVRRFASRLAVRVTKIDIRPVLKYRPKSLAHLINHRVTQNGRSRLADFTHDVRARMHSKYRTGWSAISPAVDGNLRRVRSFLRTAVVSSRGRLRTSPNYKNLLRASTRYKPDLPTLRRAVAPLAILLVMTLFVIQEIVTVMKR